MLAGDWAKQLGLENLIDRERVRFRRLKTHARNFFGDSYTWFQDAHIRQPAISMHLSPRQALDPVQAKVQHHGVQELALAGDGGPVEWHGLCERVASLGAPNGSKDSSMVEEIAETKLPSA